MKKIALVNFSSEDYSIEINNLRAVGYQTEVYHGVAAVDLPSTVKDAEVLVVQLEKVTEELLEQMPSLKLIAREGIGLDSIAIQAASKRGITVMNVPDYCLEEVAVHAVSLILAAHRKLFSASALVREGLWSKMAVLKPILINVSRGPLIHEGDLLDALNNGDISFAGLDVLTEEPPVSNHPLLHHPKAAVTNHIAWYSEQSEARLRNLTSQRIIDFLEGREIPNIVNKKDLGRR